MLLLVHNMHNQQAGFSATQLVYTIITFSHKSLYEPNLCGSGSGYSELPVYETKGHGSRANGESRGEEWRKLAKGSEGDQFLPESRRKRANAEY